MSALHPAIRAACEAASSQVLNRWQHEPDRYSVAYGLSEDPDASLFVDVTLFNINGTSCCFRFAIDLKDCLEVYPWSEPSRVVPLHRQPAPSRETDSWVDSEEEEFDAL